MKWITKCSQNNAWLPNAKLKDFVASSMAISSQFISYWREYSVKVRCCGVNEPFLLGLWVCG